MKSLVTSFKGMFSNGSQHVPEVKSIEIPLIQRDYAQGRDIKSVKRIRKNFLHTIHRAVVHGEYVNLDFIYGCVEDGSLKPLDGQQRLTTLFLLHWYLAYRADHLAQEKAWLRFSYSTRLSARLFCDELVGNIPPRETEDISAWIKDQPWYLYPWRNDPTIQSMLVMIDAIHEIFKEDDCVAAWERLTDIENPAISFHLLPLEEMGLSDNDLYIKMNSRGKPLTVFENFKARFEQSLAVWNPERAEEFARKVDGIWADLLWPYRGDNNIVDDEFMKYFHFVTEVCKWREGEANSISDEVEILAEHIYGKSNPKADEHLKFMFDAFDTWNKADIGLVFENLFAATPRPLTSGDTSKTVLFAPQTDPEINLFLSCCRNYGIIKGPRREFTFRYTLLLYAVLLHRLENTPEIARRLRILRNLIDASENILRIENMPMLIKEVERIVVQGSLKDVGTFNQSQVEEERLKEQLICANPAVNQALYQLEDHRLLRGCLASF
ncbi:MAG TPA: DUF262 domain-containing protein, partial [Alphaproteobacteria bacterium]|nr:DUF262 domain-containing protein [Alphaproteobacteria bacterium]